MRDRFRLASGKKPTPAITNRSRGGCAPQTQFASFALIRGQAPASKKEATFSGVASLLKCVRSYAAAAGDIDLCAAWLMNFFITLAHITFLRMALSFTVRPWANIPSSAFILKTL